MVIDTDFLYSSNEMGEMPDIKMPSFFAMEFEERYKTEEMQLQTSFADKTRQKIRDLKTQLDEIM